MAVYSYFSIYRRGIMNPFLLGYLYFYIAINSAKSSEKYTDIENCTQCYVKPQSACTCLEYPDYCLICCPGVSCCSCHDCNPCWHEQRQMITMTYQISISILLGLGIIGLIIIYCKICNRARRRITHARRAALQQGHGTTTHCSTVESLRDRPPPYNDAACNAPPLYTSPYNVSSMQEAPPRYPGTPKSYPRTQERSRESNEPPSLLSVTQHM